MFHENNSLKLKINDLTRILQMKEQEKQVYACDKIQEKFLDANCL
jgi:hypothetical protein